MLTLVHCGWVHIHHRETDMRMLSMRGLNIAAAAALGTLCLGVGSASASVELPDLIISDFTAVGGSSPATTTCSTEANCTQFISSGSLNLNPLDSVALTEGNSSVISDILTLTNIVGNIWQLTLTSDSDLGGSLNYDCHAAGNHCIVETGLAQSVGNFFGLSFADRADIQIESDVDTGQVVPVPPALALFGTALGGLGLLARKRKRTVAPLSA
jgi:hypothetical protein